MMGATAEKDCACHSFAPNYSKLWDGKHGLLMNKQEHKQKGSSEETQDSGENLDFGTGS